MKKKIIFLIVVIVIILLGISLYIIKNSTDIKAKGNKLFGKEYCDENVYEHFRSGGDAFTKYTCPLCDREYNNPDTAVPKICSSCATITGRCMDCGKLKK